jgi:hypothetical protein
MEKPKYVYVAGKGKFFKGGRVIPSLDLEKTFTKEALQRAVKKGILKENRYNNNSESKKSKIIHTDSITIPEGNSDVKEN